jgi:ATP-binding cassette subfamily F protein 3
MRSKDILKNALSAFDGTLILVSHDREFLDGLVNKVYEFKNHRIKEHLGGIYDFLKRKKIASFRELEAAAQPDPVPRQEKTTGNKLSYEKRKEHDRLIRKSRNELSRIESRIAELEDEIKKADDLFNHPENLSDQKLFDQYTLNRAELDKLLVNWELVHSELDRLNEQKN